jgi:hypothetical protein
MMRSWAARALGLALALVFGALAPRARADGDADLRRLFPRRAPIEAGAALAAPLWRLELTAEVISACRPDLSDLRILDAHDQALPFALAAGPHPQPATTRVERRPARVLHAGRRETPRSDKAATRHDEMFELELPPPPSIDGEWQLVLEVDAPEFVRQLAIEGIGRDAPPKRVLGSIFRIRGLRDQGLASALPSGPYERLLVHLIGEEPAPLRPRFFFETRRRIPEQRAHHVPLHVASVESVGSERRFVLERPAGVVPSTLWIQTSTPAFERHVQVFDVARGRRPVRIGEANVFRMPLDPLVEGLELELAPPSGQSLEVRIDDGDSPPLADVAFGVRVRVPSLLFAQPPEPERGATLYFGGGRARAPRYDLARLLSERAGQGAERRASRVTPHFASPGDDRSGAESPPPEPGAPVRLGPVSDNPLYAPTPPLAFATRPGAVVDARLYGHQRPFAVAPASEGLVRVALSPGDLALLRPDLGDIRVVDGSGRQWPYLVDGEPSSELVPLGFGPPARRGTASSVWLALPAAPLAPSALVLDASDAYFDRAYRVLALKPDGKSIELARGRLQRAAANPQPIVIALSGERVGGLGLEVEDGDDAPLRWTSASLRVDVPRLYVLAEPGDYRLLLGNALDAAPSYDVARARELILSVAFQDTPLGPLGDNPDYRTSARLAAGDAPSRVLLWVVLSVAVAALGAVTLRLVRQGETPLR